MGDRAPEQVPNMPTLRTDPSRSAPATIRRVIEAIEDPIENALASGTGCLQVIEGNPGSGRTTTLASIPSPTTTWTTVTRRARAAEPLTDTLLIALIEGLEVVLEGRPGVTGLREWRSRTDEARVVAGREPRRAVGVATERLIEAGRALRPLGGNGITVMLDDADLARDGVAEELVEELEQLWIEPVPVVVVIAIHPDGTTTEASERHRLDDLTVDELTGVFGPSMPQSLVAGIHAWSYGRLADAVFLVDATRRAGDGEPLDERHLASAIEVATTARDRWLRPALDGVDGSHWRYLAALEASNGTATRSELAQRLGDTTRFGGGSSILQRTADDLVRRRILSVDDDRLTFSHPRLRELVHDHR